MCQSHPEPYRSHRKEMKSSNKMVMAIAAVLAMSVSIASGQITTACASSLVSSFTPCMNFLTGSTNGGGSPTAGCCDALRMLVSSGTDCACLIFTGNVPVSLPINQTLAITLPRLCKSKSMPLQCKSTGTPLPDPGSTTYAPSLPPLPPFSSTPSSTPSTAEPASPPGQAVSPTRQGLNQGKRPLVVPNSSMKACMMSLSSVFAMFVLGTLLLNN